jgi:hypothetical protein
MVIGVFDAAADAMVTVPEYIPADSPPGFTPIATPAGVVPPEGTTASQLVEPVEAVNATFAPPEADTVTTCAGGGGAPASTEYDAMDGVTLSCGASPPDPAPVSVRLTGMTRGLFAPSAVMVMEPE